MCSDDSECVLQSESDFDEQNLCDICYKFVDNLEMIIVDSEILCCSCYFRYLDDDENLG